MTAGCIVRLRWESVELQKCLLSGDRALLLPE